MSASASNRSALEAIAVSTGYERDVPVLTDIAVACDAGSTWGLIGPNASGKTTLLRILSGALLPWSGNVSVGGEDISTMDRTALSRKVAFVPQYLAVPVAFTVEDIVSMGRTPYVSGWKSLSLSDREIIEQSMQRTDTTHLAERTFDTLSGGERQRTAVAMALAQEPDILLLDEPTAHLDIQHAWQLMEIVHELNTSKGLTIMLSSHDINLAAEFCDQLIVLESGRVAATGAPRSVLSEEMLSRVYKHPLKVMEVEGGLRVYPKRETRNAKPET